ncbi:MAG: polyphosphate kinase 2 [Spirochaetes bacterium]|nr:polyphosphate kinase 2 [Spirochaetota bacterium]
MSQDFQDDQLEDEYYEWKYKEPKDRGSVAEDIPTQRLNKVFYERELKKLQTELAIQQAWIKKQGLKVLIIFEGRDAAGKGGIIKRITAKLNPRYCHVIALSAPSKKEETQWYFQRYVPYLPGAGEMVIFDRSWYNCAGVERVMGFVSGEKYNYFMKWVPTFEQMLVESGIILIKYWVSVSDKEQERRFQERIKDPGKRWKLSPMDLQSRAKWEEYTKAKDIMLEKTEIEVAPWYIVKANDKRRARLNCIFHLLKQIPYEDVTQLDIEIPTRQEHSDYKRRLIPKKNMIDEIY